MEREGYANLIALACFGAFGILVFLIMLFCLQRYILFDNTNTSVNTNTPLKDDLEQANQHPNNNNNNNNNEEEEEQEMGNNKWFWWQFKWMKAKTSLNHAKKRKKKAGAVAPESMALQQLELATSGFSALNRLKTGHAGDIYSGVLDGEKVVVKRFYLLPAGSVDLFQVEMAAHSKAQACDRQQRRFLVPLLGKCVQGREKLLVYRHVANGDLAAALANGGRSCDASGLEGEVSRALPWTTRLKIGLGLAKALAFLHHDCCPRLEHRNIEASSVLLDKGFEVKLGSLTEVKILDDGEAPLYDMYCFGRVLLDLLSGLDVSGCTGTFAEAWMLKALPLIGAQNKKAFLQMIDPPLIIQLDQENIEQGIMGMALVAKSCITSKTFKHLSMKAIYNMLRNPENIVNML